MQAVVSAGMGVATSNNLGESVNFPIQNPLSDQFYSYAANRTADTASLINGFAGIEFTLQPLYKLQLGLNYHQTNNFSITGNVTQGADSLSQDTYAYRYQTYSQQWLLASKLLYFGNKNYHPYLFVGAGIAQNKAHNYNTNVPEDLTFTRQYQNRTISSFSYSLGFGVDVDLTSQVRLGIGYRFVDAGKFQLGSAMIDTTAVTGLLPSSHLYLNEALVQLTLLFK